VVAAALVVVVEAGGIGLEVWQAVEAGADVGLEEGEQRLEVLPVGTVVAGEEEGGVEAEGVRLPNVEADIIELLNNTNRNLIVTRSVLAR
jgi:hypothetical protein